MLTLNEGIKNAIKSGLSSAALSGGGTYAINSHLDPGHRAALSGKTAVIGGTIGGIAGLLSKDEPEYLKKMRSKKEQMDKQKVADYFSS